MISALKTSSDKGYREIFTKIDKSRLEGLPRGAEAIEKWIISLGGKPVTAEEEAELKKAGLWGMPDE